MMGNATNQDPFQELQKERNAFYEKSVHDRFQERLKILEDLYNNARHQFGGFPLLPTPPDYLNHKTIRAMLGFETASPLAAARGADWFKTSAMSGLTQQEQIRLGADGRVCCWVASCASHALSNNAPLIHVTAELAQAFADTDPSAEPSDYRMPFPAFILSLPAGLIKDSDGGHFSFILVSSIDEVGAWWQSTGLTFSHWGLSNREANNIYLCGYSVANGVQYLPVRWLEVGQVCQGRWDDGGGHEWVAPELSDQCDFSTLCRIACNSILAINHAPDLLHEESVEVRRNKGFGERSSYTGPIRWLGKTYKRRAGSAPTAPATATEKAYRPHWRRGHWHTVLHGARRALRKLQWFQPTYVNKDLEAQALDSQQAP